MKKLICEYATECDIKGYCMHKKVHESETCICVHHPCSLMWMNNKRVFCCAVVTDSEFTDEIDRILDI